MTTVKTRRINLRRVIFNSMLVISLLVIMLYVSYSWFVSSKKATVSGITMNVDKGTELLIQTEDSEGKSLELNFNDEYPLQSLAGNGQYLYSPEIGFDPDEYDNAEKSRICSIG